MSTMPAEAPLITGEELLAMGDIGPCELVDGKIVPGVQLVEHRAYRSQIGFCPVSLCAGTQLGWMMTGEVGIYTRRNPDRVRGAESCFCPRSAGQTRPPKGFIEVAPELVVEIMSPNERWQDVRQKLVEYFAIGVQLGVDCRARKPDRSGVSLHYRYATIWHG